MLYGQVLALGYDLVNLPIKGWLGALADRIIGPGIGVALLVRYGLLAAFFAITHAVAREALQDRRLALAAAIAPVGFFFIGWESLRNFADTLVMIVALMATIGVLLRLVRTPTVRWYLLLWLVMSVGLLAKYSYPPALAALVLAAVATPALRSVVLDRRFAMAFAGAVVAASPAYVWALGHYEALQKMVAARLVEEAGSTLDDPWHVGSVFTALDAAIGFVLPLLPLFLVVFGVDYIRRWAVRDRPAAPVVARWLGLYLAILLVASTVIGAVAGLERIREHYMFVLVPLPLWLCAILPANVISVRVASFVAINAALAVVAWARSSVRSPRPPIAGNAGCSCPGGTTPPSCRTRVSVGERSSVSIPRTPTSA